MIKIEYIDMIWRYLIYISIRKNYDFLIIIWYIKSKIIIIDTLINIFKNIYIYDFSKYLKSIFQKFHYLSIIILNKKNCKWEWIFDQDFFYQYDIKYIFNSWSSFNYRKNHR